MMHTTTHLFYDRLYRQNERVMKFGLEAIRRAIKPADYGYPHILVGGTNGKGQVSALFSNAVQMLGYRAGLFTSPHLVEFAERMRVNGRILPDDEIVETGMQVLKEFGGDDVPEFSGTTLTYFECCLVMALRLFARNHVDFGVFEVGLGGRLDATNALDPGLSVITSIGMDHEQYLGNTPELIAGEKAGIMRAGRPVVCGRQQTDKLRAEAETRHTSGFDALGESFDWRQNGGGIELVTKDETIAMPGAENLAPFQRDNAAVAFFALLKAQEIGLIRGDVRSVLPDLIRCTRWVGRMYHCVGKAAQNLGVRDVVMDGGHNPDGVTAFVNAIKQSDGHGPRALVVNSCRDKAIERMFPRYLEVFRPDEIFVTPGSKTSRMCSPSEYCERAGLESSQACDSLDDALHKAAKCATSEGTVYISGSLYLIGEAIAMLGETAALDSIMV